MAERRSPVGARTGPPSTRHRSERGRSLAASVLAAALALAAIPAGATAAATPASCGTAGSGSTATPAAPATCVSGFSPASGPPGGGTVVTITGELVGGVSGARFGGVPALAVATLSESEVQLVSPPGSGTVPVELVYGTGSSGQLIPAGPFAYVGGNVSYSPSVTSVSPARGPAGGGTQVLIAGAQFTGVGGVLFGDALATQFTVVSGTELHVTLPPEDPAQQAAGVSAVPVRVLGPYGVSPPSPGAEFSYLSGPVVTGVSPATVPDAGGVAVTITGSGFTGATAVRFGPWPAAGFDVASDTKITARVPCETLGFYPADVQVVTPRGTSAMGPGGQVVFQLGTSGGSCGAPTASSSKGRPQGGQPVPQGALPNWQSPYISLVGSPVLAVVGMQRVGESGGVLRVPGASLDVPAGAVPAGLQAGLLRVPADEGTAYSMDPLPSGLTLVSPFFVLAGPILSKAAQVTVHYGALGGFSPSRLSVFVYGLPGGRWMSAPAVVATAAETVSAVLTGSEVFVAAFDPPYLPSLAPATRLRSAVDLLETAGVMTVAPGYSFSASAPVPRAVFAAMLDVAIWLQPAWGANPGFSDTGQGAWFAPYVAAATGAGLMQGYGGRFEPNASLTRLQLAVVLARALKLAPAPPLAFADAASIPASARGMVAAVVRGGYLDPLPGDTFGPDEPATGTEVVLSLAALRSTLAASGG